MSYDKYIECPEVWNAEEMKEAERTLFLGGGITGCDDWQNAFAESLYRHDLVLFNPRRKSFDITKREMTTEQIQWEYWHLKWARARVFWFPPQTICPIALFELGKYCENADPLFVGCDPNYQRKIDVEVQLKLARPWDSEVSTNLEDLIQRVKNWSNGF